MRKIISLTTIPPRLPKLEQTLKSLDQQPVDAVYLNLPDFCIKTGSKYELPSWLMQSRWQRLILNYCNTDYGPATKIIPTLKAETEGDTQILICDDDHVYDLGWSQDYFTRMSPNVFVCGNGAHTSCIEADLIAENGLDEQDSEKLHKLFATHHFQFPEAFSGLLVQRSALSPERIIELGCLSKDSFYADDLVLGKVLSESGMRMEYLGLPSIKMRSTHDYGAPEWSLTAGAEITGGNKNTYMRAFPALVGLQEETSKILAK